MADASYCPTCNTPLPEDARLACTSCRFARETNTSDVTAAYVPAGDDAAVTSFGNYDLLANPGLVTLSRGLVAADVLASRLQGQDVRRSAFFAAVFDEIGAPEPSPDGVVSAIDAAIPDELIQRFA